ncbi:MAG: class I SAM-dependent methyltransferase [Cyanobacteria bacterium P01_G01_bin.54]
MSNGTNASETNQQIYSDGRIVDYYAHLQQLQGAEQVVLNQLGADLAGMSLLDLGVGGGRTTRHFAPQVARYVGLDYSVAMIAACQARYPETPDEIGFEVGDVRDLSRFAPNTFDFILFSFNGLDYISHGDRCLALKEIQRVGKPGGYFCFSSHNLQGMEFLFRWHNRLRWNPLHNYIETFSWGLLRGFNLRLTPDKLAQLDYAIIKDEPHNFRLANYYIRPSAQLDQLAPHFDSVQIYTWQTGTEITDTATLLANRDLWLYYLCRIR